MTKRETILQAIVAKMSALNPALGVSTNVYRSRVIPFMKSASPAVTVEFVTDTVLDSSLPAPYLDWVLLVRVGVYVRGYDSDILADPISQAVYLKMVEDLSLGGLTMDIQPVGVKNETYDGDEPIGVQFHDFRVLYRTQVQDLSA